MRRHKYNAKKTIVDGITFDSKREAARYQELKLLERAGEIRNLKLQPRYVLQDSFRKNGVTHRAITYVADFEYIDNQTNTVVVEDVKGKKTAVYNLKKKLFEKKYQNLSIREI